MVVLVAFIVAGVAPPRCAPVPVDCAGDLCQDARCPAGMVYVEDASFPQGQVTVDDPSNWYWVLFDVHVPAYCIGRTEVTAAQYADFLNATGGRHRCTPERNYCVFYDPGDPLNVYSPPIDIVEGSWRPVDRCQAVPHGPATSSCADHPASVVTWWGARTYCRWLGQRLPSEAEWERAAKGTEHRTYVWGDEPPQRGWANCAESVCADGFDETAPVASFEMDRSPVGAYDMVGNVGECVEDEFHLDQTNAPTDGSPWVEGPRSITAVHKGGAFSSLGFQLGLGQRGGTDLMAGSENGGFRCAAAPLVRDCSDRECGLQPLTGVSCGTCPAAERCAAGRCVRADCGADCGDMVAVPAGPFVMGCGGDAYPCGEDEVPLHEVDVPGFWLDRTEVTNAAYAAFLGAQGNRCAVGPCADDLGGALRITESAAGGAWSADEGFADHPVVAVSWYGARAYCAWRGKRLCSEAEWEKAARGTDQRIYPWGDDFPTCAVANRFRCVFGTQPVGSDQTCTSPYGVCDLAGNVWEWVEDDGHDTYDGAPTDGSAWRSTVATSRVHRGGAWRAGDVDVRASNREILFPTATGDVGGFRCCRSVP